MIKLILWVIIGWVVGYLLNQLADFFTNLIELQEREEADESLVEESVPFVLGAPGIWQFLQGKRERKRPFFLELVCIILYGALPLLTPDLSTLIVNSIHIAVLLLIIIIDLEHKAVFGIVIYVGLAFAFIGSFFVPNTENTFLLALVGAFVGFLIFGFLYKLAQLRYGKEANALGFGDVQIALLMGAMLGFHRIIFALILAMILGGVFSAIILFASRSVGRRTALPYGQYLAGAAIIMLIWGAAYVEYYWS